MLEPFGFHIEITGRYDKRPSHTMAWTGIFKGEESVFTSDWHAKEQSADVILKIEKLPEQQSREIKFVVNPGVSHFVEISATASVAPG